jgi:hypothetical protein
VPIELLGARPALGGAKNDHRPARALRALLALLRCLAGGFLNLADAQDAVLQRLGHVLVRGIGVVALDDVGVPPIAAEQLFQLLARDARQNRRIGDLVAVQVQHRKHRAIGHRVQELV